MTSSAKQSIAQQRKCGLLRRFAAVRKRIAFVAGNNDGMSSLARLPHASNVKRPNTLSLRSSYSAHAEYPVRRGLSIDHQRLWNTGSSAFADDDTDCVALAFAPTRTAS